MSFLPQASGTVGVPAGRTGSLRMNRGLRDQQSRWGCALELGKPCRSSPRPACARARTGVLAMALGGLAMG
jgi:tartrate dehydratase beta subunit/fumarate hydratase class I family protein